MNHNLKAKSISSLAMLALLLSSNAPSVGRANTGTDWPQFLGDNTHASYSSDSSISTANATTFGIKWMANLYNTDLGSPVVAFNAALGKTVVYVGNQRADLYAIDAATGQELWSTNLGVDDKIENTPMVAPDGSVWAGTAFNATMYKLDGATGKIDCSVKAPLPIDASPMYASPPGGTPTVYWASIDSGATQGPTFATNESNCAQIFSFSKYNTHAGSWTTPAYGTTSSGEPLAIVGTADTDSTEYAVDANTGAVVWSFGINNPPPGFWDIGDGATTSAPGLNGFSNGVVYVDTKYGTEYALDMTTGNALWQYQMSKTGGIASSAFDGNTLVVGYGGGLYSLNATTGSLNWQYATPAEADSSPAIVGPAGSEVVTFADLTGAFRVLSLASGTQLYTSQTGGYITSSTAEANGTVFIASSDGFLYAYGPNGANVSPPSTSITSPANESQIPNPNGNVTISGSSSDASGVNAVEVAIQSGGSSGSWYNAATGTYNSSPIRNAATLASPGAQSTAWSLQLPGPASGGVFTVRASSVNTSNIVDKGTTDSFTILPSKGEPNIKLSSAAAPPGASFSASSTGFKGGEQVVFTFFGANVATVTAKANGHVPTTTIKVPTTATFGPTSLTLTGQSSGKTTSATIDVTNNWTQYGHDASRTAMEPHDPVINASLSIGNGSVLNQSWYYQTAGPLNTSPAVVDGIAYFGDDTGTFTSLIVNAGSPQWTYRTSSGAPIRSSPAFDSSNKSVNFGSTDGNLYSLSAAGSLIRTVAIGGNPTSPVADNGKIYIGSDNGNVLDIDDSTGAIVWTDSMAGAVHSAPAYDASSSVVVTGDDTGAVTAVDSSTGAQKWKFATGGAVSASPLIYKGVVYVGSADKNFYAIKESTGTMLWMYAATAPITAGAAVYSATSLSFGDQSGTMYLVTTSGKALYVMARGLNGKPVIGVSNVQGNTFVETASGLVAMIRIVNTGFVAWSQQTGSTLSTSPTIVDGTVYIGSADGGLYAFTPQGANPLAEPRGITVTITNAWRCTTTP